MTLVARVTMPGPTLAIVRDGQRVEETPLPLVAGHNGHQLTARVRAGLLILGYRADFTTERKVPGGLEYDVERA